MEIIPASDDEVPHDPHDPPLLGAVVFAVLAGGLSPAAAVAAVAR